MQNRNGSRFDQDTKRDPDNVECTTSKYHSHIRRYRFDTPCQSRLGTFYFCYCLLKQEEGRTIANNKK